MFLSGNQYLNMKNINISSKIVRRIDFETYENGFALCTMHKEKAQFHQNLTLHPLLTGGIIVKMEGEICEISRFLPPITVYQACF